MEKEILQRGYVTHALTNGKGEIYGQNKDHYINWESNEVEKSNNFYWSEVYCEVGHMALIIRKGDLLVNPSNEELQFYFSQSKINLN